MRNVQIKFESHTIKTFQVCNSAMGKILMEHSCMEVKFPWVKEKSKRVNLRNQEMTLLIEVKHSHRPYTHK